MSEKEIPKRVFIVPYRNRAQHKFFFSKYMNFILENENDYEIYFSHQCDARTFNRGATKNIGFLAIKDKYPDHYKNITLIFNDIDTIPFNKIFDYKTTPGIVKHYYGYKYALGGIVVIKGDDFEKINGFPCFWGWGMEDNTLQKRCENMGLKIDRSLFYNIGSPEILQLFDGITRIISKKDPWRGEHDNGIDGIKTITSLKYNINDKSDNSNDNIFSFYNPNIFFINIITFLCKIPFGAEEYYNYDLREPKRQIINPDKFKETTKTVVTTKDWSNIPYYPTSREKRINVAKYLISMNKEVPQSLLKQIENDKITEIEQDVFNNFKTQNLHNIEENNQSLEEEQHEQVNTILNNNNNNQFSQNFYPYGFKNNHISKIHLHNNNNIVPPNKFSPQYSQYIGQKPRAQPSVRIGLGGAY